MSVKSFTVASNIAAGVETMIRAVDTRESALDPATIGALQAKHCNALVARGVPVEIRSKLERMRVFRALHGDEKGA
jgi:hypothetical protein